jgi:hypothetical protein
MGAGTSTGEVMPDRFVQQRFIHFGPEDRVRQIDFADLGVG